MDSLAFQDGQTVVMIGDSITDCGRRDQFAPHGNGYVKAVVDLIGARYPERRIRILNEGIAGNTVMDLRQRWHDDVIIHRPDWVTVKIGINDLHRALFGGDQAFAPPGFEATYRETLRITAEQTGARLVLIDPFYISTDPDPDSPRGQVLAALPEYAAVVERLADEFGALHLRTQELFIRQLAHRPADSLCPEPVHPYMSGHLVIALGLLELLGW